MKGKFWLDECVSLQDGSDVYVQGKPFDHDHQAIMALALIHILGRSGFFLLIAFVKSMYFICGVEE